MSETDVADRIRVHLDELSPNDRRIARQLLDHYAQAPFETAESLATKVGVSKAAVVRFAVRVGFPGFSELHEALREEAVARLSGPAAGDGGGDVIDAVAERARTDLAAMRAGVDRAGVRRGGGMLTRAAARSGSSATASRRPWPSTRTTCSTHCCPTRGRSPRVSRGSPTS